MRIGPLGAVAPLCALAGLAGCGGAEPLGDGDQRAVVAGLHRIGLGWGRDSLGGERFICAPIPRTITPGARDGVATLARITARDGDALYKPEGSDSATSMRDLVGAELHILDVCFERVGTPGAGWTDAYASLVAARCPDRPAGAALRHCGVAPKEGW